MPNSLRNNNERCATTTKECIMAVATSSTRTQCVCVECGAPVPSVVHVVHADRLTQCQACGSFADKYVEYESALIVLDMLLHRPSVYRHILCNSGAYRTRSAVVRLGCTLLFFDTYLKWLRLGGWGSTVDQPEACEEPSLLPAVPLARVTPALLLSVVEQLLFCAVVSTTARALALAPCRWASLATAVLLSSFGKCFAVLHMIWSYPDAFVHAVDFFVLTCNCVALAQQLQCTTPQAAAVVAAGGAAKGVLMLGASLTLGVG